jgi:hypothetical protein
LVKIFSEPDQTATEKILEKLFANFTRNPQTVNRVSIAMGENMPEFVIFFHEQRRISKSRNSKLKIPNLKSEF